MPQPPTSKIGKAKDIRSEAVPRAFVLSNGVVMPSVGLGTYQMNEVELKTAIVTALDAGYRMFDTASNYRNEKFIGDILTRELSPRGLSRADVFIITKLSPKDQGYDKTLQAIRKSSSLLGGYIDLFLIHWPGVSKTAPDSEINAAGRHESWRAMEEVYLSTEGTTAASTDLATPESSIAETGTTKNRLVRAIGVSNYQVRHLETLLSSPGLRVIPSVNQVELHLCYHPPALVAYCRSRGVHLQAYSPLGRGALLTEEFLTQFPAVADIAEVRVSQESVVQNTNSSNSTRNNISSGSSSAHSDRATNDAASARVACVLLKWALQSGFSVIPKSKNSERIRNNVAMLPALLSSPLSPALVTAVEENGSVELTRPLSVAELLLLDNIQETRCEKFCWDSAVVA